MDSDLDTGKLRKFAQYARRSLVQQVSTKLGLVLSKDSLARRENVKAVAKLEEKIARSSKERVVEEASYIWFNRFCALRYMDVNRITPVAIVSPMVGFLQPEILMEAKQGVILDEFKAVEHDVMALIDGARPSDNPQQEAYRLLLVAACNHYRSVMPFLF